MGHRMGAGSSVVSSELSDGVKRHCASEFERLCPGGRDFLVLSEMLQLQSLQDLPIDMNHLSTIFVLDNDHNGRVTLQELLDFATLCARKSSEFRAHELPMMIHGFCTLHMYDVVSAKGTDYFMRWFSVLFSECEEEKVFPEYPSVGFLSRDCVHLMHEVLQIDDKYGCTMQRFFDLMQRTGEEMGLMSLEDERLDELVPKVVIDKFAKPYIDGHIHLLEKELHYPPQAPVALPCRR